MATSVADIANCPAARRGYYLSQAFKLGGSPFACVILCYLIHDYKAKPNKRKAIFIYDECLIDSSGGGIVGGQLDKIDLHAIENVSFDAIAGSIEAAKQQREQALSMGWFKRVSSSSGRAIPAGLFDDVLANFILAQGKDNVWKDVIRQIETAAIGHQDSYRAMARNLPRLKTGLTAADFNLKSIGIATLNPVVAAR
jgi:hypothetical protein